MYDFLLFIALLAVGISITKQVIVVFIVAVLGSVLYSGYRQYNDRSRRKYRPITYEGFHGSTDEGDEGNEGDEGSETSYLSDDSDASEASDVSHNSDTSEEDVGRKSRKRSKGRSSLKRSSKKDIVRNMVTKRKYPKGKYHFDPDASYKHTRNTLSTPQVRGLKKDTRALLDTQQKLMGTLKEMAPVLEQGKTIIGAFDSYFGKGSGSEGDLEYMKKRLGITSESAQ